jgi:hypothetical protein
MAITRTILEGPLDGLKHRLPGRRAGAGPSAVGGREAGLRSAVGRPGCGRRSGGRAAVGVGRPGCGEGRAAVGRPVRQAAC